MKLIKPSFEIWEQPSGLEGIYKQIERVGRVCYSPDTEVLTDSGWKRIDNLLATDKVVSYNPDNNTIVYDDPNLVVNEYDDDMIIVNHPNIKMCITKDHRIYQSVPEKRDYTFLKAAQVAGLEKIPHSKQCRFRIPKYFLGSKRDIGFHLPSIVYSKEIKNGNRQSSEITINIPCNIDFMVIAGAFISEGHTYHGESYGAGSYCQITQDENSELYSKVITALTNLGWNYKIYSDPRKTQIKWIRFGTNQCWVMAFDDLFGKGSKNKHLPVWFRVLSDEYLETLISTMYLGDGSHNTTRNEKYLSISKRLLDEVQEVFILLGINGTSNFSEEINQMCYFEESHRDSWIISRNKHISTVPYKGKVYCTSTKSGIICIRYKGKTCWCGNCYKSENKITEDSAKPFVDRMVNSGHGAMLEHGTVYLHVIEEDPMFWHFLSKYKNNPYSRINYYENIYKKPMEHLWITTNYRVLVENNWLDDLKYICEPTPYHAKRVTVHFVCDRGVSHEFVRHRVMSFAQESTRYCNYSKDKFGNEITFIDPCWTLAPIVSEDFRGEHFLDALENAEEEYLYLIENGWKPQQARTVLPNALKTELVMTGFVDDWWGQYLVINKETGLVDQVIPGRLYTELDKIDREKYRIVEKGFFPLRCSNTAHPQAQELAIPLRQEFIDKKIW